MENEMKSRSGLGPAWTTRTTSWLLPASGAAWGLSFVAARLGLERIEYGSAGAVLLALLPVPFFAFFLRSYVRAIRRGDELERRIQLEALAFAFPITVMLLMVLGLLELATELNPDDWSYRHVWMLTPLLYFGGLALARRRYR